MCQRADSLQTLKNQLKHVLTCGRAVHHKDQKDIEKESGQYSTLIPQNKHHTDIYTKRTAA